MPEHILDLYVVPTCIVNAHEVQKGFLHSGTVAGREAISVLFSAVLQQNIKSERKWKLQL